MERSAAGSQGSFFSPPFWSLLKRSVISLWSFPYCAGTQDSCLIFLSASFLSYIRFSVLLLTVPRSTLPLTSLSPQRSRLTASSSTTTSTSFPFLVPCNPPSSPYVDLVDWRPLFLHWRFFRLPRQAHAIGTFFYRDFFNFLVVARSTVSGAFFLPSPPSLRLFEDPHLFSFPLWLSHLFSYSGHGAAQRISLQVGFLP